MNELDIERITYPRVSEIISLQTPDQFRYVSLEDMANACVLGTKVHEYCTAYLLGVWTPRIEKEYLPYVETFKEWADSNIDECLFASTRLFDDCKRFTGEFDLIVKLKDSKRIAMIDIKTSSAVSKSWPIQLAAYKHLCIINNYPSDLYFNLHLKKSKKAGEDTFSIKPKLIPYEELNPYWEIFSSALTCYDYFNRKEKKNVCI